MDAGSGAVGIGPVQSGDQQCTGCGAVVRLYRTGPYAAVRLRYWRLRYTGSQSGQSDQLQSVQPLSGGGLWTVSETVSVAQYSAVGAAVGLCTVGFAVKREACSIFK